MICLSTGPVVVQIPAYHGSGQSCSDADCTSPIIEVDVPETSPDVHLPGKKAAL
jgi:hypothetical protein